MSERNFIYHEPAEPGHAPLKTWTKGVPVEEAAMAQLRNIASLPFIHHHVAAMPDVHLGKGATVGSVIATRGAVIPAAVGVDIGCGMCAVQTSLRASDLPDNLARLRAEIEKLVPVGQSSHKEVPRQVEGAWYSKLKRRYEEIEAKHPAFAPRQSAAFQLGTLGGGNHFVEICLDEAQRVWIMLHSGSRNIGNKIGNYFIEKAREDIERRFIRLPDKDLAYFVEGDKLFDDYIEAVSWAQDYALENRRQILDAVCRAVTQHVKPFVAEAEAVNCHHNYVARENHFGQNVWVTRKGAVRARAGDLGIIPGSMGARSYIVRGLGNPESFCSCSHGAGRAMSRGEASRRISLEEHIAATEGVECRKDEGVLDESPRAYKPIEAVMAAQSDLVEIVAELKQVLCVKG